MKIIKHTLRLCLLVMVFYGCTEDDANTSFVDQIDSPTNISANVVVTQDNTGLVTITPQGEGATSYVVTFGDGSEDSGAIQPGNSASNIYEEGAYEALIIAYGLNGLSTTITLPVIVSFQAPENLEVTISNDAALSKTVNVEAYADFATFYEVSFGEDENAEPAILNNDEVVSYTYEEAGVYTITVVALSAAIETISYTEDFEVTEIVQPLSSAPGQPSRADADVVSIFSGTYTDIEGVDFYPNWGQLTAFNLFNLEGDEMLQYTNLNYQGIDFSGTPIDVSQMEYLHVDIWTADENEAKLSPISSGPNETAYDLDLTAQQWTSFDIPLSFFTDQNPLVDLASIIQLKLESVPEGGAIFVDNIYFYRESEEPVDGVTPITFESEFELSGFDGGGTSVVENPDANGNSSAMVLEMVKGGGQPWAGSKITMFEPFNVTSDMVVTAKVWSPRVGLDLLMKMEDDMLWPDTSATAEITATTTVANQWETLIFDFSDVDTSINWYGLVLIMDNGTQGDGSSDYTIYVDDISTNPLLDFEVDFTLSSFDGGGISVIANPDMNGNSSGMVAEMIKGGGQTWAGSKITVPAPFEVTSSSTMTIKVWSPRVGLELLAKMEDNTPWPDVASTAEITATTTVANQWETLTFDFSGTDTTIDWNNLVLIMDNGTQGDGSSNYTIYIDDITLN
ncbi:hypothetical protein [Winogradskyella vidalii]|uniref:hypothetical protein n=1 Tax=Winogradskyella vidalii TaxID=2615024 RepID=UPI0015CE14FA|nr:hypothetical protein [Winogradskyella vidalii]